MPRARTLAPPNAEVCGGMYGAACDAQD